MTCGNANDQLNIYGTINALIYDHGQSFPVPIIVIEYFWRKCLFKLPKKWRKNGKSII